MDKMKLTFSIVEEFKGATKEEIFKEAEEKIAVILKKFPTATIAGVEKFEEPESPSE